MQDNFSQEVTAELLEQWRVPTVIAVDIETNTDPDPDHPAKDLAKYGLSYNAEITDVSLAAEGLPSVVFDMRPIEGRDKKIEFLREVLSRDNITVVGHNAIFDLRQLGGHYGFVIARHSLVWDTMTVGIRMMLGDVAKEARQEDKFNLLALAARMGVYDPKDKTLSTFMDFMKDKRSGGIQAVVDALVTLHKAHPLWKSVGGYVPPTFADQLRAKAALLMTRYVAMDATLALKIQQRQQEIADQLVTGDVRVTHKIRIPKWPDLPTVLNWLLRGLRVAANQSIRGIDIDAEYLEIKRQQYRDLVDATADNVFNYPNPYLPYEGFEDVYQGLMFYSMVLGVCHTPSKKDGGPVFSKSKNWVNWSMTPLSADVLVSLMEFTESAGTPEEALAIKQQWAEFLLTLDSRKATRSQVVNGGPETAAIPIIDLEKFLREQCFQGLPEQEAEYRANIMYRWYTEYYRQTKPVDVKELVHKGLWAPYCTFILGATPLPTHENIIANSELATATFHRKLAEEIKSGGSDPEDLQAMLMEKQAFSFGAKALTWYIKTHDPVEDEDDLPPISAQKVLRQFVAFTGATDKLNRSGEWMLHAAKDGRVHSVVIPSTRTGRDSSTLPNVQNIDVGEFSGVFIAPAGYVFVELDYANAENKTGAMVGRDNVMAMATESGDFHANMAAAYFPEQWAEADAKERKRLRKIGKGITFGIAYGMGAKKLAQNLHITVDEAKRIIALRNATFAGVAAARDRIAENCQTRYDSGSRPAWINLWDQSRVMVPSYPTTKRKNGVEVAGYKTWNYIQQGSVAVMVHRATVEAAEWLEDEGYDTYIAWNIHDSLIVALSIEEYNNTDVLQKILQILCRQMPTEFCHRTMPPIHFVSEVGPENARKWGYRHGQEYPIPLDTFVNQWGKHKLPQEILDMPAHEHEAPTWVGPVHEGYTLEGEMAELRKKQEDSRAVEEEGDGAVAEVAFGEEWFELQNILKELMPLQAQFMEMYGTVSRPASYKYTNNEGETDDTGLLVFPDTVRVLHALWHTGRDVGFPGALTNITDMLTVAKKMIEWLEMLKQWEEQHGDNFGAIIANAKRSPHTHVPNQSPIIEKPKESDKEEGREPDAGKKSRRSEVLSEDGTAIG
jgi:hypothetical protein